MKKIKTHHGMLLLYLFLTLGIKDILAQTNWKLAFKYAGTEISGNTGNLGLATSARVNYIKGMAFDKDGNLFITDFGASVIRKIDAKTGIITLVAGTGTPGFSGDGSAATSAALNRPMGLVFDNSGNLYFADQYGGSPASCCRIRKINTSGIISTVAGTGVQGHSGDGAAATLAQISPTDLTIDPSGNILFTEHAYVRKINSFGVISTIAGTGTAFGTISGTGGAASSADIYLPNGHIKTDDYGNIYLSETPFHVVRKIDAITGIISVFAGTASSGGYSGDGSAATSAKLFHPGEIEFDELGNVYINDERNYVVRKVTPGGTISTIAGNNIFNTTKPSPLYCTAPKSTRLGVISDMEINQDGTLFLADQYWPRIIALSEGLRIKDVDINTLCVPGYSIPGVTPQYTVTMSGGVPPYNYSWSALSGNNATLSSTTSGNPLITGISSPYLAYHNLTVTDNAGCSNTSSRKVKTQFNTNPTFDLAMRDSYYDMLDEPNSQAVVDPDKWDIWYSQDLWNRLKQDGKSRPQDACSGSCTNYMYGTVRNVGCRANPEILPEMSTPAQLKFYWSMGGTRQIWPGNWTTDMYAPGLPQGLQIATIPIPVLNPGQKTQLNANWTAPNPTAYFPGTNSMLTCFLARIVDHHQPGTTDGMTFQEVPVLKTNLNNNNNIVMRNSKVIRINNSGRRFYNLNVGNSDNIAQVFSLDFSNTTLGGGTLDQFATITLSLGPVFDAWVTGGAIGTYAQVDYINKTVTFDGTTTMTLDNILFAPGEEHFIGLEFAMNTGVDGTEMQNEEIHFRQLYSNQNVTEVYGAYDFLVVFDGETAGPMPSPSLDNSAQNITIIDGIKIYPNPSSTVFNFDLNTSTTGTLTLMDASGRIVSEQKLENQTSVKIDVRLLESGVYFYKIQTNEETKTGSVIIGK